MQDTDPIVIDPAGSNIQGEIARIRERGPVAGIVLPGGVPAWSVTGRDELAELLAGPDVSKDPEDWPAFRNGEIGNEFPLLNWVNTRSMFTAYGSEHRRLRQPVAAALTAPRTAPLEPRIQAITADLLAGLDALPQDQPVNLREEYAYPLPLRVLNELLGVPDDLAGPLRKCVDGIFDFVASPEKAMANYEEMIGLLLDLVEYRRGERGEDVTSTLIAHVDEGDITEKELVGTLYLTINAGHETTVNLIDWAIYLLLTHREHRAAVLDGSLSWLDVIEEALRYEAPIAHMPLRYARKKLVIGSVEVNAGDPILVSYAGAGRDPKVYGDSADTFDPTRTNKDHIAFGHGAHRCVGSALARMEAQMALPALFMRFPHMKLAVGPEDLGAVSNFVSNGHDRLPVSLHG
ncbi:cytochrome P450 family protein [Nocardia rhamnosiphila]|uniref:Cytochrome P450 n=1 Tax=Nocardia rhamnosiphila TaxID=426716 RepID=A0ABV2WR73_9NOCA